MSSLPFQAGSAFVTRNNSLIIFGGQNATTVYTNNLYQLTQTSDSFTWEELPQNNPPPGNLYGQAVISSTGQTMLLLGGLSEATVNREMPIQMYLTTLAHKLGLVGRITTMQMRQMFL